MSITMYEASVPVFTRTLTALRAILQKAAQHAEARKIDPTALLQARLYPDMFTFTRQVQIATDFANSASARLAGKEPPSLPDTETTFADLMARVDRTLEHLRSFKPQDIDGSESREIVRPLRGQPHRFTGTGFLLQYVLPNFFFHAATAYDILRHNGIELGKSDFIGPID
ncbi:MAG TPA: DUF1993 domain-containing protein [Casimicrobiaceae bacterium]|nr:DUF1993 domain-containing protein [Casimicrobiaceae bacterium]